MTTSEPGAGGSAAAVGRGVRLVATWARWSAWMSGAMVLGAIAVRVYVEIAHPRALLARPAGMVAVAGLLLGALVWSTLRAEELRLARELRTARTGSASLRALVTARRQGGARSRQRLGTAAVLLADGDRPAALEALSRGSPLMRWGRLERVRAIVEADLERATGTTAGLERCIEDLRARAPVGNREADLYALHVQVKAILELGDAARGRELAVRLLGSDDEEERVYAAWLRAWFELDAAPSAGSDAVAWPELGEGELRLAALLARAHGAGSLVERLDARLAAIARTGKGE